MCWRPFIPRFLVGLLVLALSRAHAAGDEFIPLSEHWHSAVWQTDEGLPDNKVSGVVQTADGFVWVATFGGLARFDGAAFEEFSISHLPDVPNRIVRKLFLDGRGRLWLAADRGAVICLEGTSARVLAAPAGFPDARVSVVAEDEAEAVWFVTDNGLYRVRGDQVERMDDDASPAGGGAWIAQESRGTLWLARGSSVGVLRGGEGQTRFTLDSGPVRLAAARGGGMWGCTPSRVLKLSEGNEPQEIARLPGRVTVRVMLEDSAGALWIGTAADGLLCLRDGQFERVAVSHPDISALLEDREGNLWVGTSGGGLNMLRPRAINLINARSGLPFEYPRSVCQDGERTIWVALQNGALVRGRGLAWSAVTAADGWSGGNAACVAPARDGGVWIGTRDRGLQRLHAGRTQEWGRREGLGSQSVRSLLPAANGDLWVATDFPNRLKLFRQGELQAPPMPREVGSIRAMAEGADGTIWAGTTDGQILRVSNQVVVNEADASGEGPYAVRCLHATAEGSLWIGYAGGGVGRWRAGCFARITTTEGLYHDYISQILSDAQGGLWLNSNRGLFYVRQADLAEVAEGRSECVRSVPHGRSEGLPNLQPLAEHHPTAWRAADGQLWFSTRNGLLVVQMDRIRDNPTPPPVLLRAVKVDDQLVALLDSHSPLRPAGDSSRLDLRAPGGALKLPPGHGKLEFSFTALSFRSAENVQFRHHLAGFDTEWIEAGSQRHARYARLPAGNYMFEVTAGNEAGVWNEAGVRLAFTVAPFFWQTWWFRLAAGGAFAAGVAGLVRYVSFRRLRRRLERLERQAELQKERARIARDMHDEVGAKLARLSLLGEMAGQQPGLPPAARDEVGEISDTARDTIRSFDAIVWAVNPKHDTLASLGQYLCRFAEELFEGSDVQCGFDVPDDLPAVELPTETRQHFFLAAKEALTNALKHARAKHIWVRLKLTSGGFEIQIEDDGCGFVSGDNAGRARQGNGLANMRERMESVGGRLDVYSAFGTGTRVTFGVPCPELQRP
jgi:signal transduction histidine kinase/ligand-binding sensor domain-containing protein